MDWATYAASPTLSVYNNNSVLWVALYATSEDTEKLQMFIVGHHYKKNAKDTLGKVQKEDLSSTHLLIGKDKVLSLFELYFKDNKTEKIIKRLSILDKQFEEETKETVKTLGK